MSVSSQRYPDVSGYSGIGWEVPRSEMLPCNARIVDAAQGYSILENAKMSVLSRGIYIQRDLRNRERLQRERRRHGKT